MELKNIEKSVREAASELISVSGIKKGDILIVGCSSSEVLGEHIGKGSSLEVANAIYMGLKDLLKEKGIYLAAQCCEHLNRAVILEREAVPMWIPIVNVVPKVHAGGSFAMTVYENSKDPVAVENINADAGLDIGDTLIGMHLKAVAVPVRLKIKKIGEANLVAARTRPKFIGGERATYDKALSGGEVRD